VTNVNTLSLDRSAFKVLVSHIPPVRETFERLMQERDVENWAKYKRLEGEGNSRERLPQPSQGMYQGKQGHTRDERRSHPSQRGP